MSNFDISSDSFRKMLSGNFLRKKRNSVRECLTFFTRGYDMSTLVFINGAFGYHSFTYLSIGNLYLCDHPTLLNFIILPLPASRHPLCLCLIRKDNILLGRAVDRWRYRTPIDFLSVGEWQRRRRKNKERVAFLRIKLVPKQRHIEGRGYDEPYVRVRAPLPPPFFPPQVISKNSSR